MANPIGNEKEIFERIERENITIDKDIREMLSHHIKNDLNHITCGLGQYMFCSDVMMEKIDRFIKDLHEELGDFGPPAFSRVVKDTMESCVRIRDLLNAVLNATTPNKGKKK